MQHRNKMIHIKLVDWYYLKAMEKFRHRTIGLSHWKGICRERENKIQKFLNQKQNKTKQYLHP